MGWKGYSAALLRGSSFQPSARLYKPIENELGQTTVIFEQKGNFFPNNEIRTIYTSQVGVSHEFKEVKGVTPEIRAAATLILGGNNAEGYNLNAGGGFKVNITPNIVFSAGVDGYFQNKNDNQMVYGVNLPIRLP